MKTKLLLFFAVPAIFALNARLVQAQSYGSDQTHARHRSKAFFSNSPNLPVLGAGTTGQLTMWTGTTAANSYIGDSIITQSKLGLIGIGTTSPTSQLTVSGMVEITLGGLKFPDGTVQTTAGLNSIFHDGTLSGSGTGSAPLGVSAGGIGTLQLANAAVSASKIAPLTVVRSLSGLTDDVALLAGPNISIIQSGNTLTFAAPNSLNAVAHDGTLTGDGTTGSPLGVAPSAADPTQAFAARSGLVGGLENAGRVVVQKTVPAGSYTLEAAIWLHNADSDNQTATCTLSTGDKAQLRLPGSGCDVLGNCQFWEGSLSLLDTAVFTGETTVTVTCQGFAIDAQRSVLVATRLGSIQ